jgi:diaminopimelate epimerase
MNYINSDGSLAEMCGNGSRCTADFFIKETGSDKKEIKLDTRAGIKEIKINDDGTYSVNMGAPMFESNDFPGKEAVVEGFNFNFVSMGNPHAVTMVDDVESLDFKTIGQKVENNSLFPNKINVEFIEKKSDNYYKVKVWERGCGATLACGTGACAVYAVIKNSYSNFSKTFLFDEITLEFPGGKLLLSENNKGEIILRGPATFVFKGEI